MISPKAKLLFCLLLLTACRTTGNPSSQVAAGKGAIARMQAFWAKDRVVEIKITAKQWEAFRTAEPEGGTCNFEWEGARYEWVNFEEMVIDGVSYKNVGVRKKSYCGSKSASRPAMNVDLSKFLDENKDKANDHIGTDRLVLNNSKQDDTFVRQCIAYQVFKEAGIAAPHCNFAHMVINDVDFGIYVSVQPMRKDFMNEIYGKELGVLYEITKQNYTEADLNLYKNAMDAFNDDESMTDIKGVIDALGPNGSLEKIEATVDVDQFTRAYAADIVLANWDGYFARLNNGYIYFPPKGGKQQALPWGPDKIMSTASADGYEKFPLGTAGNRLLGALAKHEAWRNKLKAEIRELQQKHFVPETILARMDTTLAKISPFVLPDQKQEFDEDVSTLKQAIKDRPARLEKVLARIDNYRFPLRSRMNVKNCYSAHTFLPIACDSPERLVFNIISLRDMSFHIETVDGSKCLANEEGNLTLLPCADQEDQLWLAEKTDHRDGSRDTSLKSKSRCLTVGKVPDQKISLGFCSLSHTIATDWVDDPI